MDIERGSERMSYQPSSHPLETGDQVQIIFIKAARPESSGGQLPLYRSIGGHILSRTPELFRGVLLRTPEESALRTWQPKEADSQLRSVPFASVYHIGNVLAIHEADWGQAETPHADLILCPQKQQFVIDRIDSLSDEQLTLAVATEQRIPLF